MSGGSIVSVDRRVDELRVYTDEAAETSKTNGTEDTQPRPSTRMTRPGRGEAPRVR